MADAKISDLATVPTVANTVIETSSKLALTPSGKIPIMAATQWAKTHVLSKTTAAPPMSPAENDRYYVPTGATGAWTGLAHMIAEWMLDGASNGQWYFSVVNGLLLVQDEGTAWLATNGALSPLVEGPPNHVSVSANYTADGTETTINCTAPNITIKIHPARIAARSKPIRVRFLTASAGTISISDGSTIIDAIVSPIVNTGQVVGWRDCSTIDGSNLLCEGMG